MTISQFSEFSPGNDVGKQVKRSPFNEARTLAEISDALMHHDRTERTNALKSLLQNWIQEMQEAHFARECALILCQKLSWRIDLLLQQLASPLLQAKNGSQRFCMIALAGYGRAELYPHSDIDLLILCEDSQTGNESFKDALQGLLYPLWDIGLRLGNSIHNPSSAITFAEGDHCFASALFEMRFICGSEDFYQSFLVRRQKMLRKSSFVKNFVHKKKAEKDTRYHRHTTRSSMLEPNLKEDKGTMRDLHYIRWLSTALCGKPDPVSAKLWSPKIQKYFVRAYQHFAEFRLAQNFFTDVNENRFLQSVQPHASAHLGFRSDRTLRPAERMMKLYFLTQGQVILLGQIADHRADFRVMTQKILQPTKSFIFLSKKQQNSREVLTSILRPKQTKDTSIAAHTLEQLVDARTIFHHLSGKDLSFARKQIRDFLCQPKNPQEFRRIARLLHHSGVLGLIVPEYRHVAGLIQTDGYHAYPVGIHTLQVIEHLHAMAEANPESPHTEVDALLLQHKAPEELFFAAFLHDIAKGQGGEHAKRGAKLADVLAPKFGFSAQQTATIVWLVRHHLLLSDLALHRDILDSGTAEALVQATPDRRVLDLLYCLSVADIRAVAPNIWNAWKATVISRLHESAHKLFAPDPSPQDRARERTKAENALREALVGMSHTQFNAHIARCSSEYLLSTTLALQVEHARMLSEAHPTHGRECAIVILPDPEGDIVRLVLYTADYSGLVAHTVGVLTNAGFSIVTLKIFPYAENGALLTVWFHLQGKVLTEKRRLENIEKRLRNAVQQRFTPLDRDGAKPNVTFSSTPKILIDNAVSKRATVIEVQTLNRAGLLFDLALALSENRLRIISAKVDTIGQRAMDVFYVCDRFGLKIDNPRHQEQIYSSIKARLSSTG